MSNTIVPPGVSGREPKFDARVVNLETVANELALLNLGDFEPLKFKINTRKFMEEIKTVESKPNGRINQDTILLRVIK